MQILLIMIMALVMLAMLLKLTFHRPLVVMGWALVLCLFVSLMWPWAIEQSRTVIASSLSNGALMLNMAVLMSIDVALGFAFCAAETEPNKRWSVVLRFMPQLLVFPMLFALLVITVFALPGVNFQWAAGLLGIAVCFLVLLLSAVVRWLLPERSIRLEMLFLTYLLIALLGVIATVNGRTTVTAVNHFELKPLLLVVALVAAGIALGMGMNHLLLNKKLKNIS